MPFTDWQTLKDSATQLLIKYKSGALVTQYFSLPRGFIQALLTFKSSSWEEEICDLHFPHPYCWKRFAICSFHILTAGRDLRFAFSTSLLLVADLPLTAPAPLAAYPWRGRCWGIFIYSFVIKTVENKAQHLRMPLITVSVLVSLDSPTKRASLSLSFRHLVKMKVYSKL